MVMMQKETEKICKGQVWYEALFAFKAKQYRPILAKVIPKFVSFLSKRVFLMLKIRDLTLTLKTKTKQPRCGKKSKILSKEKSKGNLKQVQFLSRI